MNLHNMLTLSIAESMEYNMTLRVTHGPLKLVDFGVAQAPLSVTEIQRSCSDDGAGAVTIARVGLSSGVESVAVILLKHMVLII